MFQHSRRNLARWFTLSMGSILVLFAAVAYYREVISELTRVDQLLYQRTQSMVSNLRYRFRDDQWQLYLENVPFLATKITPIDNQLMYVRWYDSEKQLVQFFGAPAPSQLDAETGFKTIETVAYYSTSAGSVGSQLRQLTVAVHRDQASVGYLQVAIPLASAQATLYEFRLFMAIAVPVSLGLISLVSYWLGGRAMQPIHQVNQHLARFTADVSHELRTPLTAILNNAHIGLMADTNLEQHSRLQKVVDLAELMSSLISNLLLLARYQGSIDSHLLTTVNLNHLLRRLAEDATPLLHQQQLISHIPQTPVVVIAAPHLLRQAVSCLLDNAHKYTPADGTIQLRLFTRARQAVIEIEDTGIGIPPEDLPHIFERFYRVDKDRSRQTGGFGLGLAIAQQIITAHRGYIDATSAVGQGSIFRIVLPLKEF